MDGPLHDTYSDLEAANTTFATAPHRVFDFGSIDSQTAAAAAFFKALSHKGRLTILCLLTKGEKSVGELEQLVGCRQAAVSQQLSRLREDGLVTTRREGKAIFYSLRDPKVSATLNLVQEIFAPNRAI